MGAIIEIIEFLRVRSFEHPKLTYPEAEGSTEDEKVIRSCGLGRWVIPVAGSCHGDKLYTSHEGY
jgi:hypothetical protein